VAIHFDASTQIFHLQGKDISYALQIIKAGHLIHLYYGKKVDSNRLDRLFSPRERASFSPNPFPEYGTGDFRHPSYQVELHNGTTVTEFLYVSHRIIPGKPALAGLPATYVESEDEAETLEIVLKDDVAELELTLSYTVFRDHNAITRSARLRNIGKQVAQINQLLSASVDFPHSSFDFVHLSGAWARERHLHRRPLAPGHQLVDSKRGSSSHQQNPFIALAAKDAVEEYGEVYGFNLVYSGNFIAQAEVDQFATTRVSIGLNPFDFRWQLEEGESFQTPEAVLVYSDEGFGGMSRTYHRLYRARLCRGVYRDKERPILINNWEGTYFDFTADKIEQIAAVGKEVGLELDVRSMV
jgi:alpha-galactosidase